MHRDLEFLIVSYDSALGGTPESLARFKAALSDFLEHHPNVREEAFMLALRRRHAFWQRAQRKPPTLPA